MSKPDTTSAITSFWTSVDKLTVEGFKVAWFGVAVSLFGLFFTQLKWLSWFGLGATVLGLVLRHRSEHLKKKKAAPRKLSTEQINRLVNDLKAVVKQPMTIGFFGQDPEAKAYATEFKGVFENAGFTIVRLEGFLVFDMAFGLEIVAYNSGYANETTLGIQAAVLAAGLKVEIVRNQNKMEPALSLNVHAKPSD